MLLGTEVGLSPGDIELDGNPAPSRKGGQQPPLFGQCLMWSNGSMDQDTTWYGGRPRPRQHCVRWGLSSPKKRGIAAAHFSAHVYCGQTVAHLSHR